MAKSEKSGQVEEVIARLEKKAAQAGHSLEEYTKQLLSDPEGDLVLNDWLELLRERYQRTLRANLDESHAIENIFREARNCPYDTNFSLNVDYDIPVNEVAAEAGIILDASCVPVLLQEAGKNRGKAKIDFSILDLWDINPSDPKLEAYIKSQGLQTDVGSHELIAVFKKYPRIFNLDTIGEVSSLGLFSMGNGFEEKEDEEEKLVQEGLLIDDDVIVGNRNCYALRIGKVAEAGRFRVRKLLTIKNRKPFKNSDN